MSKDFVTVLPSAARLMESLRDIGYDVASAVADLVDNSVDANAQRIEIRFRADGSKSWIRVADDGIGMSPRRLDEAMRYGSEAAYHGRALGQFGLGLKTASLSQCRRLTVASRAGRDGRAAVRRWDLDQVLRRNSWDLERIALRQAPSELADVLPRDHGTVVLWEGLDRILSRRSTPGLTARALSTARRDVRQHLAMVFHRFLAGEAYGARARLSIVIDGEPLEPWDPFARDEPHTRELPRQVLTFVSDDHAVDVDVSPYVLPNQELFSSQEAHRLAAGPNRWNRQQGFYVYRRDRLIQAGGWNRLRTLDEHAKLARIAVDLPIGREQHFGVDVAKMRVGFPEEVRSELRLIASATVAVAQERYRDHLASDVDNQDMRPPMSPEAISLSRDWPAIMRAVEDVLGDDPTLRDRLLLRLANADPAERILEPAP